MIVFVAIAAFALGAYMGYRFGSAVKAEAAKFEAEFKDVEDDVKSL